MNQEEPDEPEYNVSKFVVIAWWVIVIFIAMNDMYYNNYPVLTILGVVIIIASARACARIAKTLKHNQNLMYSLGMLFGFVSLIIYWITYKIKTRRKQNE